MSNFTREYLLQLNAEDTKLEKRKAGPDDFHLSMARMKKLGKSEDKKAFQAYQKSFINNALKNELEYKQYYETTKQGLPYVQQDDSVKLIDNGASLADNILGDFRVKMGKYIINNDTLDRLMNFLASTDPLAINEIVHNWPYYEREFDRMKGQYVSIPVFIDKVINMVLKDLNLKYPDRPRNSLQYMDGYDGKKNFDDLGTEFMDYIRTANEYKKNSEPVNRQYNNTEPANWYSDDDTDGSYKAPLEPPRQAYFQEEDDEEMPDLEPLDGKQTFSKDSLIQQTYRKIRTDMIINKIEIYPPSGDIIGKLRTLVANLIEANEQLTKDESDILREYLRTSFYVYMDNIWLNASKNGYDNVEAFEKVALEHLEQFVTGLYNEILPILRSKGTEPEIYKICIEYITVNSSKDYKELEELLTGQDTLEGSQMIVKGDEGKDDEDLQLSLIEEAYAETVKVETYTESLRESINKFIKNVINKLLDSEKLDTNMKTLLESHLYFSFIIYMNIIWRTAITNKRTDEYAFRNFLLKEGKTYISELYKRLLPIVKPSGLWNMFTATPTPEQKEKSMYNACMEYNKMKTKNDYFEYASSIDQPKIMAPQSQDMIKAVNKATQEFKKLNPDKPELNDVVKDIANTTALAIEDSGLDKESGSLMIQEMVNEGIVIADEKMQRNEPIISSEIVAEVLKTEASKEDVTQEVKNVLHDMIAKIEADDYVNYINERLTPKKKQEPEPLPEDSLLVRDDDGEPDEPYPPSRKLNFEDLHEKEPMKGPPSDMKEIKKDLNKFLLGHSVPFPELKEKLAKEINPLVYKDKKIKYAIVKNDIVTFLNNTSPNNPNVTELYNHLHDVYYFGDIVRGPDDDFQTRTKADINKAFKGFWNPEKCFRINMLLVNKNRMRNFLSKLQTPENTKIPMSKKARDELFAVLSKYIECYNGQMAEYIKVKKVSEKIELPGAQHILLSGNWDKVVTEWGESIKKTQDTLPNRDLYYASQAISDAETECGLGNSYTIGKGLQGPTGKGISVQGPQGQQYFKGALVPPKNTAIKELNMDRFKVKPPPMLKRGEIPVSEKYFINTDHLGQGVLSLRYRTNRHLTNLKQQYIGHGLRKVINDSITVNKIDPNEYHVLPDSEKHILRQFLNMTEKGHLMKDQDKAFEDRLSILWGEFQAGNDNEHIKKELKQYILHAVKLNKLPRSTGYQMIMELAI